MNVALKPARREDLPVLVRYVHAFQRLDQRPFNLHRTEQALLPLLGSDEQGRVWIIEAAGRPIGYLALCFGYSLNPGGREALIDGFFVEEEFRNRGIGAGVLKQVLGEARAAGLVVVHVRPGAAADRARRLLTAAGLRCREPVPMLSADLGPAS